VNYPNAVSLPLKLAYWIRAVVAGKYDDDYLDDVKATHSTLSIEKQYATHHDWTEKGWNDADRESNGWP
jgi:hypothetical protein